MDSVAILRDHLANLPDGDQAFARSLLDQARERGLSDKQMEWVVRLATKATSQPERVDVTGIMELFGRAARRLRRPQLVIRAPNGMDLRLSVATASSRTPGLIIVTSPGGFAERAFYGRIGEDGIWGPSLKVDQETQTAVVAALQALAVDPAAAAAEYGKLTGHCSFCSLPLSDARSLEVGYGKRCAEKYGLPYGNRNAA